MSKQSKIRNSPKDYIKNHYLVVQFGEYIVGGGVFFWTGYGTFALFYSGLQWNWLLAKMIGDAVGWTANFFIQRYWAFNNSRLRAIEGVVRRRYITLSILNFAIDYVLIASLKSHGISPYAGFFISAAFFTGWNYVWYRFWVFNPTSNNPPTYKQRDDTVFRMTDSLF